MYFSESFSLVDTSKPLLYKEQKFFDNSVAAHKPKQGCVLPEARRTTLHTVMKVTVVQVHLSLVLGDLKHFWRSAVHASAGTVDPTLLFIRPVYRPLKSKKL